MKKKLIIAAVISLFLLTACSGQLKIKFFDEENNALLKGPVYIDGNLAGESDGYFELPKEYCDEKHRIGLESEQVDLEWDFFPEDCKLDQLVLKHTASTKKSRKLLFVFLEKNTNKTIGGELFFDEEKIDYIEGEYSITREDCRQIEEVKLISGEEPFIWQFDKNLCDENDIIEFFVS